MKYLPHYHGHADRDIPGEFGWVASWWCETCHGLEHEPETICVSRQTDTDPAEYEWVCPICGSTDVNENDDPKPFRATRRRRIHSTHSMRIAA